MEFLHRIWCWLRCRTARHAASDPSAANPGASEPMSATSWQPAERREDLRQSVEITFEWSPGKVRTMHRLEDRLRRRGWTAGARSGDGLITFVFEGPADLRSSQSIRRAIKKVTAS